MQKINIETLNTKFIGKNIIKYETITSTQDVAREYAKNNIQEGSIILADTQTLGKGTHGRKWISESNKNLTFTMVLYPKCNVEDLKDLTVITAKCIVKAIKNLYGHELSIKIPNDLMIEGKKVGGILTEITSCNGAIKYLLIGIGLNLNQEEFPEEIRDVATSLKIEFGNNYNKEELLSEICNIFEKCIADITGTYSLETQ